MKPAEVGRGIVDGADLSDAGPSKAYRLGRSVGSTILAVMWGFVLRPDTPEPSTFAVIGAVFILVVGSDIVRVGLVAVTVLIAAEATSGQPAAHAVLGGLVLLAANVVVDALKDQGYDKRRRWVPFWSRWWDAALLASCAAGLAVASRTDDPRISLIPRDLDAAAALVFAIFVTTATVYGAASRAIALRERETEAAAAVQGERARIARELHDVVAHRLSGVVIQAQVARALVDESDGAGSALATIEDESRAALDELRSLLGALRADVFTSSGTTVGDPTVEPPQERLDDERLARIVTAPPAGITEIEAEVTGELDRLPAPVALQALRILQEAVANAARHAPGSAVRIKAEVGPDTFRLCVKSSGGGPSPGGGTGVGLLGMRERAAIAGGVVEAGPHEAGWKVELVLPITR